MDKAYFNAYCIVQEISPYLAANIIDGRYKPYLSALDDQYYSGSLWNAKLSALQSSIKAIGVEQTRIKLRIL